MSIKHSFLISCFAFAMVGCGKNEPAASASDTAPAETPDETSDVRTVEITGNDQMKFNLETIEATAGETLRVVLINVGQLPKAAMGHNWVLLKAGVKVDEYAMAAATAGQTDYIPADRPGDVIVYTKLLGPGERDEVTFVVPEPGEYPFVCSFPGHAMAGMKGLLIVK